MSPTECICLTCISYTESEENPKYFHWCIYLRYLNQRLAMLLFPYLSVFSNAFGEQILYLFFSYTCLLKVTERMHLAIERPIWLRNYSFYPNKLKFTFFFYSNCALEITLFLAIPFTTRYSKLYILTELNDKRVNVI